MNKKCIEKHYIYSKLRLLRLKKIFSHCDNKISAVKLNIFVSQNFSIKIHKLMLNNRK